MRIWSKGVIRKVLLYLFLMCIAAAITFTILLSTKASLSLLLIKLLLLTSVMAIFWLSLYVSVALLDHKNKILAIIGNLAILTSGIIFLLDVFVNDVIYNNWRITVVIGGLGIAAILLLGAGFLSARRVRSIWYRYLTNFLIIAYFLFQSFILLEEFHSKEINTIGLIGILVISVNTAIHQVVNFRY